MTHAGNSAADSESALRNFAEHSKNCVRNVAARWNFAQHFGELIEISREKSLGYEISDDISNEVSPWRRNFEGWHDNGAAEFHSRRCDNSMTNEISQFFAAFRCFSTKSCEFRSQYCTNHITTTYESPLPTTYQLHTDHINLFTITGSGHFVWIFPEFNYWEFMYFIIISWAVRAG